jgi:hypothetical protein
MATEKKVTQTPITDGVEAVEDGSPITINTGLFKTFLQFAGAITDEQVLRFHDTNVSFRSRDKGNTTLGIVKLNSNFHQTGEIGIRTGQLLTAMPKTDVVSLTFGKKIGIESTDYRANFLVISAKDPGLTVSKLKSDFPGKMETTTPFIVGSKDFYDKVVALKSVFSGDPFLALVSDESEPSIITLTTDDNSVGDVHYRLATSLEKGETWSRSYDYERLIPLLKVISQYTQEIKVMFMIIPDPNAKEPLAALILSGATPDGAVEFSYSLAPRIPIEKGE